MTEDLEKQRIQFFKKLSEIRKESLGLDWETDKAVTIGRSGYRYISIYKMKRNLAPLFAKHGMEILPRYKNLQVLQVGSTVQFSIELDVLIIDVDTGYTDVATVFGCAPGGDKGPTIAMSFAMKQWLSDQFMLIDGIDPEDATSQPATGAKFAMKTPEEVETAKSQILSKAIRPMEEKPQEEPEKAPEQAAAPAPEAVKEAAEAPNFERLQKLSKVHANTIENIINTRTKMAQEGKMSVEEYNQMSSDYLDIVDSSTAVVFIKKYKVSI